MKQLLDLEDMLGCCLQFLSETGVTILDLKLTNSKCKRLVEVLVPVHHFVSHPIEIHYNKAPSALQISSNYTY